MTDHPPPLTPPDCDLRGFAFMPLDVVRLRDSGLAIEASGDEFRAAVLLWCASWHQVPAASLPDDERALAVLAGYGRDARGWKRVRDGAMRGWVRCSDGRLYHPVIAAKALESMHHKTAAKRKREADAERLRLWRETQRETRSETRDIAERPEQIGSDRIGSDRTGSKAAAAAAASDAHEDPRLAAAAAQGAYLDFQGEDQRAAWLVEFGDLTAERIAAILGAERLPNGQRIRLPSGFATARAMVEQREATRAKRRARTEDPHDANVRRSREVRALIGRLREPATAEHLAQAEVAIRDAAAILLADERNAWLRASEIATVRGWMATAEVAP